jgi:hypothetical protein
MQHFGEHWILIFTDSRWFKAFNLFPALLQNLNFIFKYGTVIRPKEWKWNVYIRILTAQAAVVIGNTY